jgi:hypothetical protein
MGKYQPNPQYDQEFSEAMRLKLRLNREARSRAGESPTPPSAPSMGSSFDPASVESIRDGAIRRTMAAHPGLTSEEVDEDMKAMGF